MVAGVAIGHLVDRDVGMEDRHPAVLRRADGNGGELEAEQLPGDEEHSLDQLVELQVLLHLVGVEVVPVATHLLGVVAVVPRLDGDAGAPCFRRLRVGDRLHVGDLLGDAGGRGGPDGLHELEGAIGRLGHAVLELPVGVGVVAQQADALGAQRQDLGDHGVVVVLVAVVAARVVGAPHLLTQGTLVREGEEGVHRRAGVGDGVLALAAALGRRRRGGLDERVRQASELVLGQVGDVALLVGQDVVRELRVELGEALVDRRVALLGLALERGAVAREAVVGQPDETLLVGAQRLHLLTLVDRLDALEEGLVLGDLGAELGQAGGHLLLDLAELGRRQVRGPDAVVGKDPLQVAAGPFHGQDGVLESRWLGIGDDGVDLLELPRHTGFEGGLEGGEIHLIERRNAAVGAGPFGEEDVVLGRGRGHRLVALRGRIGAGGGQGQGCRGGEDPGVDNHGQGRASGSEGR